MGLPPVNNRDVGKAVINVADRDTYNLFLKNILHMTEYRYKRRLVKRVFRYGSSSLKEVESDREIAEHLDRNINDITYIEASSLDKFENAKVILRLW